MKSKGCCGWRVYRSRVRSAVGGGYIRVVQVVLSVEGVCKSSKEC